MKKRQEEYYGHRSTKKNATSEIQVRWYLGSSEELHVCGVGVNYLVVMLAANTADLHENKSFYFFMIVEIKINI